MSIDAITFNNSYSWKIAYWSVNDLSRGAIGSKNTYTVPLLYSIFKTTHEKRGIHKIYMEATDLIKAYQSTTS